LKILIAINKDLKWTKAETAVVYCKVLRRNIVEETEKNPEILIHRVRIVSRDSNLPLLGRKKELLSLILAWSLTVQRMFLRNTCSSMRMEKIINE
jgi:hypothetical protein